MIVVAWRAAVVLYNILKSAKGNKPFLLPANICPIVPLVFLKAGRPFEFTDISMNDYCMDRDTAINRLESPGSHFGGVLFLRPYGAMVPGEEFFRKIKEIDPKIFIIDDQCLGIPKFEEDLGGADVVLYSTGRSKYADIGFGGYAFIKDSIPYTDHQVLYKENDLKRLTAKYKTKISKRERFNYIGSDWLNNSSMDISLEEYWDRVGRKILDISGWKHRINEIYMENLPKNIQLPQEYQDWRFHIRVPESDKLIKSIFSKKLFASRHYASLPGIFGAGCAPKAEDLHSDIINLFNDKNFSPEMALKVTKIVAEHLKTIPLAVSSQ